jgi:hypothetical protein
MTKKINKYNKSINKGNIQREWYKKLSLLSCIVIFLILIIITIINTKTIIIDDSTYDIIRKAENNIQYDPLVEKEWNDVKSDFILRPFLNNLGYENIIIIFLTISMLITLILFYKIIDNYIFFLIFAISPFFIKKSLTFSNYTIILPLLIGIIYSFINKKYYLTYILFIIITWFNFHLGLFLSVIIIYLLKKRKINLLYSILFILPLFFMIDIIQKNKFIIEKNIFERIIFDFGSSSGIPIIIAFLMFICLIILWKKEQIIKIIFLIALIISYLNLDTGLFILNLLGIYCASIIINMLINEKWHSTNLKNISIFLIICSIMFSGISFTLTIMENTKNEEFYQGLSWLKEKNNINENDYDDLLILSHYKYGNKIKFFSNQKVLLDSNLEKINLGKEKYNDVNSIFESRNLNKTLHLMNKYEITYILITTEMKQGLVWNKDNEGLIFLMNNNDQFFLKFKNDYLEIWSYNN